MYTICKHLTHVLIDTGTSHPFVLHAFTQYLNVLPECLNSVLLESTPGNGTLLEDIIYKSCIIEMTCRKLSVDLITLNM